MRGHFALAYLGGSNKLRAYLFFIYGLDIIDGGISKLTNVKLIKKEDIC